MSHRATLEGLKDIATRLSAGTYRPFLARFDGGLQGPLELRAKLFASVSNVVNAGLC